MTPAQFIKKREGDWRELEDLLKLLERRVRKPTAQELLDFARLYRSACTDLSLAQAYRLPREMQVHLENLVSRGHGGLYSQRRNRASEIKEFFLRKIPFLVYKDTYVRICQLVFFVPFFLTGVLAYQSKDFAAMAVGEATLMAAEQSHSGVYKTSGGKMAMMAGFYISNNVGIDLLVFGLGILGGIGSLLMTFFNSVYLGCIIGYLLSSPVRDNILSFIMCHAPFELTAIGISAGAGLRIGYAFIAPAGRTRMRALLEEARSAVPVITAAALLTFMAAFIEAVLGPSRLELGYKIIIASACTLFLILYFGVLGFLLDRGGYRPEELYGQLPASDQGRGSSEIDVESGPGGLRLERDRS